jgi:hypothetical protein
LTLGGLLKHLAFVEDYLFTTKLTGQPVGAPWDFAEWDDEDWPFPRRFRRTRAGGVPRSAGASGGHPDGSTRDTPERPRASGR